MRIRTVVVLGGENHVGPGAARRLQRAGHQHRRPGDGGLRHLPLTAARPAEVWKPPRSPRPRQGRWRASLARPWRPWRFQGRATMNPSVAAIASGVRQRCARCPGVRGGGRVLDAHPYGGRSWRREPRRAWRCAAPSTRWAPTSATRRRRSSSPATDGGAPCRSLETAKIAKASPRSLASVLGETLASLAAKFSGAAGSRRCRRRRTTRRGQRRSRRRRSRRPARWCPRSAGSRSSTSGGRCRPSAR